MSTIALGWDIHRKFNKLIVSRIIHQGATDSGAERSEAESSV
jgi:hypothetical protein